MCRWVQLVLPSVQAMQVFSSGDGSGRLVVSPPHTTSFPPDRRERLWKYLGPGKSGMEHVSEEGGGKISTEERVLPSSPPTTNCPDAKIAKDNVTWWGKKQQMTKMRNLFVHLFPGSYFGIGPVLKISTVRRGRRFAWLSPKLNWWVCVVMLSTFCKPRCSW